METNFQDEFLPIHHPEVSQATGVCAKTLKKLLLTGPGQFSPDAYQILRDGLKVHLRFNPMRHIRSLEEKKQAWLEKQTVPQSTSAGGYFGRAGATDAADKSVVRSPMNPDAHSMFYPQRESAAAPSQGSMKSGAEALAALARSNRKSR